MELLNALTAGNDVPYLVAAWCDGTSICCFRTTCKAFADAATSTSSLWDDLLRNMHISMPSSMDSMSAVLSIEEAKLRCKPKSQVVGEDCGACFQLLVLGCSKVHIADAVSLLAFGKPFTSPFAAVTGFDLVMRKAICKVTPSVTGELALLEGDMLEIIQDPEKHLGSGRRRAVGMNMRSTQIGWFSMSSTTDPSLIVELDGHRVGMSLVTAHVDSSQSACSTVKTVCDHARLGRCGCLMLVDSHDEAVSCLKLLETAIPSDHLASVPQVVVGGPNIDSEKQPALEDFCKLRNIPHVSASKQKAEQLDVALALAASQLTVSL